MSQSLFDKKWQRRAVACNASKRKRLKKIGSYALKLRRDPQRVAAWNTVYQAVREGRLIRPSRCERCGRECKPQAHHPNYLEKLKVIWFCRPCHLAEEGKIALVVCPGDPRERQAPATQ